MLWRHGALQPAIALPHILPEVSGAMTSLWIERVTCYLGVVDLPPLVRQLENRY